jgi:hypothetical protein
MKKGKFRIWVYALIVMVVCAGCSFALAPDLNHAAKVSFWFALLGFSLSSLIWAMVEIIKAYKND